MTNEEREKALLMVATLESEVLGLVKAFTENREWSLAIIKLEEGTMWMRKAIERG